MKKRRMEKREKKEEKKERAKNDKLLPLFVLGSATLPFGAW